MLNKTKYNIQAKSPKSPLVTLAFIFSFLYWIYLGLITQMVIAQDAIGYESLGSLIYREGWIEYFKTGPNREPLYPFLVSISMRIADMAPLSYQSIQRVFQILILFITQLLTLRLLEKIKINSFLIFLTILYIGFSPAIVNSGFCLFSEIVTYPIVLSIILLAAQSWLILSKQDPGGRKRFLALGFMLGFLFVLACLTKGIFELLTPLFILPYIMLGIKLLKRPRKRQLSNFMIFLLTFFITFYTPITLYKFANKKYNGTFALTDRGASALYGHTARRMEKLTKERVLTALALVPGNKYCYDFFGQDKCTFWSYKTSDTLRQAKEQELSKQNLSKQQINKKLLRLSIKEMLKNPLQYTFLVFMENLKMFFWESTTTGFVAYPDWLSRIFENEFFASGLNFVMALLPLLSLVYLTKFIWQHKKNIFSLEQQPNEAEIHLFCIFVLVVPFIALHGCFLVLERYILPIVPLYLASIVFFLQRTFSKKRA